LEERDPELEEEEGQDGHFALGSGDVVLCGLKNGTRARNLLSPMEKIAKSSGRVASSPKP
jgi:hypothetical protein